MICISGEKETRLISSTSRHWWKSIPKEFGLKSVIVTTLPLKIKISVRNERIIIIKTQNCLQINIYMACGVGSGFQT